MRILGISGLWSNQNPATIALVAAFAREFPGSEAVIQEERFCHPWQIERLKRFVNDLVEKYDDGIETLIVGHSMGGVVGCATASRIQRTPVVGVVTVFSPHQYIGGLYPKLLGTEWNANIPVISFQAVPDQLVPYGARHPHAREHHVLCCTHQGSIPGRHHIAKRIARTTRACLEI